MDIELAVNMEVIGNRRAAKDGFTASHRSIHTFSMLQAIDINEAMLT